MGGANGLIVAFVVAVWAAYFVPLVLRRYDEASTSTSLESLSPLSRVISRRPTAEVDDAEETAESAPVAPAASAPRKPVAPTRRAAIVAARRRRRTLITLLTGLAVVGGLAAASVIAPAWVAAPAALVVAWLVACRVQVRSERGLSRPRRSTSRTTSLVRLLPPRTKKQAKKTPTARTAATSAAARRPVDPAEEETVVVSGQLEDVDPGRKHVMEQAALDEDALDDQVVIAVPSVATSGEALWDPLPVTLPTYVTKPRVGRTVRTIDFDQPGAWTSGHVEGEDVELPGRSREQQAEAPRRASGE